MLRQRIKEFAALGAGAIYPFAFAPFKYSLLAVLSLAILFACWRKATPKQAFVRGFLFGLGMFGVGVSWVFISLNVYAEVPVILAAVFTLGFVAFLALYLAVLGLAINSLFPSFNALKALIVFPASWVLWEWVRSWLFTGFPWLILAHTQTEGSMRGFIPLLGCYGTGFLLALTSSILMYGWYSFKEKSYSYVTSSALGILLLVIWIGPLFLNDRSWTQPRGKLVRVALVQGAIKQDLKWHEDTVIPTVQLYLSLTLKNLANDIIIWPETAIPLHIPAAQNIVDELKTYINPTKTSLVTGIPIVDLLGGEYYNGVIVIGNGQGTYLKRHLVPFGEFVPFSGLVRGLLEILDLPMKEMIPQINMTPGAAKQPLFIASGVRLGVFICYEIAFAEDLLRVLPTAELLVTVSNDAWFGDSFASAQHLQIGQFRALQSGRELVFSTNDGITAFVDAKGRVVKQAPRFVPTVLNGRIQPMTGATPWALIGNLPIIVLLACLLVGVYFLGSLSPRRGERVG